MASRTEESANAFAERFGIPRAYGGWEELAHDEDVDVVYVATPHAAHRAAAGMCLSAGRNSCCREKAFTLNAREAEELVALAKERGRLPDGGHVDVLQPALSGGSPAWCGTAPSAKCAACTPTSAWRGPSRPRTGCATRRRAVGALLDLGVYPVSFAQLLLGEPADVSARAVLSDEGVDLQTAALLSWESGALASVHCSVVGGTATTASVTGVAGPHRHPVRLLPHRPLRAAPRRPRPGGVHDRPGGPGQPQAPSRPWR
ncbi:scyllo-inositol 2-dehydrogenase (NADP(+)) IolU [Streptomyces alboniger]